MVPLTKILAFAADFIPIKAIQGKITWRCSLVEAFRA